MQSVFLEGKVVSIANVATRSSRRELAKAKARMQDQLRRLLDALTRPEPPVFVTFVVQARGEFDLGDNVPTAMKYHRDTVARWLAGKPERIPVHRNGVPVIHRGCLKMTRPPAPDDDSAPYRWFYEQQLTPPGGNGGVRVFVDRHPPLAHLARQLEALAALAETSDVCNGEMHRLLRAARILREETA